MERGSRPYNRRKGQGKQIHPDHSSPLVGEPMEGRSQTDDQHGHSGGGSFIFGYLAGVHDLIGRCADVMPDHAEYIAGHCAAQGPSAGSSSAEG